MAPIPIEDHAGLAAWAADCAEHVLAIFESEFPAETRPRQAIAACRAWVRTRQFRMADVRAVSLAAHAAARLAKPGSAAQFAARAAGQAAATPHVATHALGPAWYGAKAADALGLKGERDWQYRMLPVGLRGRVLAMALQKPSLEKVLRYPGMQDWPRPAATMSATRSGS